MLINLNPTKPEAYSSLTSDPPTSEPRQAGRINWMLLLKLAIVALIVVFIVRAVQQGQAEFAKSNISLSTIRYPWLFVASAGYLLGMFPMSLNWHRMLVSMQQPVPLWTAVRAHYISQLGKYVPGKACVVAIRLSLLSRFKLHTPTTIVSMMAEVLAMMSVGSVVASVIVAIQFRGRPEIALVATGLALAAGLPIIPPILRFTIQQLERRRAKKKGVTESNVTGKLTWGIVIPGWLSIIPGWMFLGISMFAAMKAIDVEATRNMTLWDLPWITASYAISLVAGFMSMLPGGVLVREWVMKELIEPSYGPVVGLVAPVIHRMVILVSELVLCSILYGASFVAKRNPTASPPDSATP